jgi:hypothetical protein
MSVKTKSKNAVAWVLFGNIYALGVFAIALYPTALWLDIHIAQGSILKLLPASMKFISAVMLSVTLARFMFGLQTTREYFGNVYKDMMLDVSTSKILERKGEKNFVQELPDAKLEKVHYELIKKKSNIEFKFGSTFFKTMSDQIEPLLGKIHYEKMDFDITNEIREKDGQSYIYSDRTIEMELHTRTPGRFSIGINSKVFKSVPGFEPEELYQLESFKVGEQELDVAGILEGPEIVKNDFHSYKFPYDWDFNVVDKKEGVKINIVRVEKLILPVDDYIRWTISPDKSLRQISVKCRFNEDIYPKLWIFGIQKNETSSYKPKKPDNTKPKRCSITDWTGWMLPYHGFIIGWKRKD